MRLRSGFFIPINVVGPGLCIAHIGPIVISNGAKIGSHVKINVGVVIGENKGIENVPKIGNNVIIEPGCKIFGNIQIADGIHIGANAVVNKSFLEPGIVIAGVPARKIKNNPDHAPANVVETINQPDKAAIEIIDEFEPSIVTDS
jgi:serine O-acetyltransferase